MKYFFETYGCQMNTAESAAMALAAKEHGWTEGGSGEDADLVLLNSCSVRATAEQRLLGRLAHYAALKKKRRAAGEKPFVLVIAGCMAERAGEKLKEEIPALDYVIGTQARSLFPYVLEAAGRGESFSLAGEKPDFSFSDFHLDENENQTQFRSFVPVMHGCDNFCSYCIVPYVRGREKSRAPSSILEEIRLVSGKGVREITLLGQNVNSYLWEGALELPAWAVPLPEKSGKIRAALDFSGLLELIAVNLENSSFSLEQSGGKINTLSRIKRVRFLSSHPKDLSAETIRVMAEYPVFCRHLHLCVQHGSNRILEAMNRRYTREKYLELVSSLRSAMPDLSLSTDILVGFPGETEEDLESTLSLMEEVKFLYAYMYHYNPREGTAAYELPGRIKSGVRKKRLERVIGLQQLHTAELLKKRVGQKAVVLIEGISRKNADELVTRTERDEMAVVPGPAGALGSFAELTLSSLKGNTFRSGTLKLLD